MLGKILFVSLATLAFAASATEWGDDEVVAQTIASDRFVAGETVSVAEQVTGDLLAAGGDVVIGAEIGGDLVIAGGNLRLAGSVGHDLYAAGGRLDIDASIERNARIGAGSVRIGPTGRIAGNVTAGGGEVLVRGSIGGYLQAAGGRVYVDGPVGGDVELAGDQLELGPGARIEGRLRYRSPSELRQAAGAEVKGGIEWADRGQSVSRGFDRITGRAAGLGMAWTIGLLLAAALMAGALPGVATALGETFRTRIGWSLLWGFVALVCIPVAGLILLVTIIGAPLALVAIAAYLALLLSGYIATGVGAGTAVLAIWQPARFASTGWRIAAAALGMLVIVLLGRVPWIGGFVGFLALILGVGALLMHFRRSMH